MERLFDFSSLATANIKVGNVDYSGKWKEDVRRKVKEKLRDVVLSRFGDNTLWWYKDEGFKKSINHKGILPVFDGVNSGSGDSSEYADYFIQTPLDIGYVFQGIFTYILEDDGLLLSHISEDGLKEYIVDTISCLRDDAGEEVDEDELEESSEVSAMVDFCYGMNEAGKGHYNKALEVESVSAFVEDLIDIYGGENILEPWFVLENLSFFIYPMLYGCSDYLYRAYYFSDKEIYLYGKYKDKLPCDMRSRIENALKIVNDPFGGLDDTGDFLTISGDLDETQNHVVMFLLYCNTDAELCEDDFNPFFGTAYSYLKEKLPELRKTYGEMCL